MHPAAVLQLAAALDGGQRGRRGVRVRIPVTRGGEGGRGGGGGGGGGSPGWAALLHGGRALLHWLWGVDFNRAAA